MLLRFDGAVSLCWIFSHLYGHLAGWLADDFMTRVSHSHVWMLAGYWPGIGHMVLLNEGSQGPTG